MAHQRRECRRGGGPRTGRAGRGSGLQPPKRARILEWQKEQEFPILPNSDDPDPGNVYHDLQFPDAVYERIEEYYEQLRSASDIPEDVALAGLLDLVATAELLGFRSP
jgi:hypothetical protein